MIKKQSDDPNVAVAADHALLLVQEVLKAQPKATQYNYGGHEVQIGEYGVCESCTSPIAEAQQVASSLRQRGNHIDDPVVREHLELAAQLLELEAQTAIIRAEFHNGKNTEPILNVLLGYQHDRSIQDTYDHSHTQGNQS
jgi:hypothetical protein